MTQEQHSTALEADLARKLERASALFGQGQLDTAELLCREVLTVQPQAPAGLHLLGLIRFRNERYEEARDLLEFAVHHAPASAALHNNLGNALRACGDLAGARSAYRSAILLAPDMVQAHNNLGLVKDRLGDVEGALAAFSAALEVAPQFPEALVNRGVALRKLGDEDEAIACLRSALDTRPTDVMALHNLSLALKTSGLLDEARTMATRAVKLAPAFADAQWNLSDLMHRQGDDSRAQSTCELAISLDPTLGEYYETLESICRSQNKLTQAEQAGRDARQRARQKGTRATEDVNAPRADGAESELLQVYVEHSDDLRILVSLASFYQDQGDNKAAITGYRRLLDQRPEDIELSTRCGLALTAAGRLDEALAELEHALGLDDRYWLTHYALGQVLMEQSNPAQACDAFERALAIDDTVAAAHCALGTSLVALGEIARARGSIERALEIEPTLWQAWRHLASIQKGADSERQRAKLETALRANHDETGASAEGQFALAKMLDESGAYEKAFATYHQANQAARPAIAYHPADEMSWATRTIEVFSAERMKRGLSDASTSEQPIFIVGMPRSGSTLVEQILCSHPRVAAAGELSGFFDLFRIQSQANPTPRLYVEAMDELDCDLVKTITTLYLDRIRELAGIEAPRITDKTLHNYIHLGLIGLLFPNARIIHCKRHVMDCCLSIYFHYMTYVGYSAQLYEIGHCYRIYEKLMQHWKQVLGDRVYDVQYEDLISDQEGMTRSLLQSCELDWDDRCLQYHRHERAVMTSSNWQVRQPLYASAVGRWRRYDKHLDELRAGLGEYAPS